MATPKSPGIARCTSLVSIHISCKDLKKMGLVTNNTMVVLYEKASTAAGKGEEDIWQEKGRTELVRHSLNPKFVTPIIFEHHFERTQTIRFVCFDFDETLYQKKSKKIDPFSGNYIGEYTCKLSEICANGSKSVTKELVFAASTKRGAITLSTQKVNDVKDTVRHVLYSKAIT
jgi:acyl-CoA thioesterase FadM